MVSNARSVFLFVVGGEVVEGGIAFCVVGPWLEFLSTKVEVIGGWPSEEGRELSEVDLLKSIEFGWGALDFRGFGNFLGINEVLVEFWIERGSFLLVDVVRCVVGWACG